MYRSTRKLSVTEDGKRLLAETKVMLDAAQAGLNAVADGGSALSVALNVTAPAVLTQSALVDRIAAFSNDHPKVTLSLDFSDTRPAVIDNGIDVAIRMGWLQDSALKARKLYEVERVLATATTYAAEQPAPTETSDLEQWRWLELTQVGRKPEFRKPGMDPLQLKASSRLGVNDAHVLYRLSRAGAGLALLPEFLITEDLATGAMTHVLPGWAVDSNCVYAVWPPNAPKSGLTARFVEALSALPPNVGAG